MRRSLVFLLCFSALLSGCSGQPNRLAEAGTECGKNADPGALTRLAMIRRLLDSGHPYAALAHLDAAGEKSPAIDHLRADALRRIGQAGEARVLYQSLLSTCLAGAGYHGLGLLAGEEGRLDESVKYLRQARQVLPADARVRSDLGYALMLVGELEAARYEFLTAQDLSPDDRKAALNLVLLLYRQGDAARAEAVAKTYQVSTEELTRLREDAARMTPPVPTAGANTEGDKR